MGLPAIPFFIYNLQKNPMFKYDILIPAYNAEKTLPVLSEQLLRLTHPPDKIWIVDDGSTDRTATSVNHPLVNVNRLNRNHGKGYALRSGYHQFLEKSEAEYLICMDADLQHPVNSVEKLIDKINKEKNRIVIGNRDKSLRTMPAARVLSNTITSFVLSKVTRQEIKDSQCGFRAIHREVLQDIHLQEDGFQMETEFILRAAGQGWKIDFIPIPTIYNGSHSYIKHVGDTYRFICLVFKKLSGKL